MIGRYTVAGQPSDVEIGGLVQRGFGAVVNVRMPGERMRGERERVEALGLQYIEVPILLETMSGAHATYIREALAAASPVKVLIHCADGRRAALAAAAMTAQDEGSGVDGLRLHLSNAGFEPNDAENFIAEYFGA